MDDALDLDAVRLLSTWMAARRDLTAHLDLLTAFGPSATDQVSRNLRLIDDLQGKDQAAWSSCRDHMVRRATDAQG